jgi:glycosyltransferase involved in cell wall biosynthesis
MTTAHENHAIPAAAATPSPLQTPPLQTRPLKIWLPALATGSGSSVFVQRLARGLERQGHTPVVQWFAHASELAPWLLGRVPAPAGTDIVHANTWQGFAFKRSGIPLVVTEHHYVSHPLLTPLKRPLQRLYHHLLIARFNRWSYAAADAVTTVSQFCADAMAPVLRTPAQVIPNWVDTEAFAPSTQPRRPGPFRLLFVGNPAPWKGADILPLLAQRLGSDVEILCMGGLRKGFRQDELPGNMTLLPPRPPEAMPLAYHEADAALVPTRYETFGYVAAEAMACGLPVLGFDRAGTGEICRHEETALLAPVDDIDTLERYIRRLLADRALAERLGKAGRQRALALYSEEPAIRAYVSLYQRLRNQ